VLTSFQPLHSVPSAPTLALMVLSVHPTVSFLSFSLRLQLGSLLQLNTLKILIMPSLIASK
jgi:hypothetical protein